VNSEYAYYDLADDLADDLKTLVLVNLGNATVILPLQRSQIRISLTSYCHPLRRHKQC